MLLAGADKVGVNTAATKDPEVISQGAKAFGCNAGIVITARHNPPSYNGFKIKAHFGGPASPEMIKAVEAEMEELKKRPKSRNKMR